MAKKTDKIVWYNHEQLKIVQKTASSRLDCSLVTRDGVKYINIREMYRRKSDLEWKYGINGFAVPFMVPGDDGEILYPAKELLEMLQEAFAKEPDFALDNPSKYVMMPAKDK